MFSIDTCKYFRSMLSVSLSPSSNVSNQLFSLCDLASSFFLAVLMDPAKRFEYDFTGIYEIHKYTLRVCNTSFEIYKPSCFTFEQQHGI
jgi:hypothetical protein